MLSLFWIEKKTNRKEKGKIFQLQKGKKGKTEKRKAKSAAQDQLGIDLEKKGERK